MNRIQEAFQNKKAFIPFITGGDPSLEITERLLYAMEEAGADLIEIGIPFSDPTAEGVVIQKANERALEAGCTTDKLFDTIKRARKKVRVPMVFLTYVNPIYTYGKERFMKRCVECGIDGLIVPDMPFEEKGELAPVCADYGVAVGFGISTPQQAKEMAGIADGAIVGSAIVKIIEEYGKDAVPSVAEYVQKMKRAVSERSQTDSVQDFS